METLVVTIKRKNKAAFTKELLKSFDFLEVKEEKNFTEREMKIIKNLSAAFTDVNLSIRGKKNLKTLQEVINGL